MSSSSARKKHKSSSQQQRWTIDGRLHNPLASQEERELLDGYLAEVFGTNEEHKVESHVSESLDQEVRDFNPQQASTYPKRPRVSSNRKRTVPPSVSDPQDDEILSHSSSLIGRNGGPRTSSELNSTGTPKTRSKRQPEVPTPGTGTRNTPRGQSAHDAHKSTGKYSSVSNHSNPQKLVHSSFKKPRTISSSQSENGYSEIARSLPFRTPAKKKQVTCRPIFWGPTDLKPVNEEEVQPYWRISSANAVFVSFNSTNGSPVIDGTSTESVPLYDPTDALCELTSVSGVSTNFITPSWVANHYRWVVWKLACYERMSLRRFTPCRLTWKNVIQQLQKRYRIEYSEGRRPPLRKIIEGDERAERLIVLVVANITSRRGPTEESQFTMELTDGWYSIEAWPDLLTSYLISYGKIYVGMKLRVSGASLSGDTEKPTSAFEPADPLECCTNCLYPMFTWKHASCRGRGMVSSSKLKTPILKLPYNGTQIAHSSSRLGHQPERTTKTHLTSVFPGGGVAPLLDVCILRRHSMRYLDPQSSNGKRILSDYEANFIMDKENNEIQQLAKSRLGELQHEQKKTPLKKSATENSASDFSQGFLYSPNELSQRSADLCDVGADSDRALEAQRVVDEVANSHRSKLVPFVSVTVADFCSHSQKTFSMAKKRERECNGTNSGSVASDANTSMNVVGKCGSDRPPFKQKETGRGHDLSSSASASVTHEVIQDTREQDEETRETSSAGATGTDESCVPPKYENSEVSAWLPRFSSGSGKRVEVKKESLEKAKTFLDDMVSESESLQSNATGSNCCEIPSSASSLNGNLSVSFPEEAISVMTNDAEKPSDASADTQVSQPSTSLSGQQLLGFTSGLGKTVTVSEQSLKRARRFLSDVAEPSSHEHEVTQNSISETSQVNALQHQTEKDKPAKCSGGGDVWATVPSSTANADVSLGAGHSSLGFTSGSGKPVTVSQASLDKARRFVTESCDSTLNGCVDATCEQWESASAQFPVESSFPSFTSGTGRPVTVSRRSLQKASCFLSDTVREASIPSCNDVYDGSQEPTPPFPGFTSGSGKHLNVNASTLETARAFVQQVSSAPVQDLETSEQLRDDSPGTAVSSNAFAAGELHKIVEGESTISQSRPGTATGTVRIGIPSVEVGVTSVEQSGMLEQMPAKSQVLQSAGAAAGQPLGFVSGLGTRVTVGEESLKKAQRFLSDVAENTSHCSEASNSVSLDTSTSSPKAMQQDPDDGRQGNSGNDVGVSIGPPSTLSSSSAPTTKAEVSVLGFTSGLGKRVTVSEVSLDKAKRFVTELPESSVSQVRDAPSEEEHSMHVNPLPSSSCSNFTSGTSKAVPVSEASLKKAEHYVEGGSEHKRESACTKESIEGTMECSDATSPSRGNRTGTTTNSLVLEAAEQGEGIIWNSASLEALDRIEHRRWDSNTLAADENSQTALNPLAEHCYNPFIFADPVQVPKGTQGLKNGAPFRCQNSRRHCTVTIWGVTEEELDSLKEGSRLQFIEGHVRENYSESSREGTKQYFVHNSSGAAHKLLLSVSSLPRCSITAKSNNIARYGRPGVSLEYVPRFATNIAHIIHGQTVAADTSDRLWSQYVEEGPRLVDFVGIVLHVVCNQTDDSFSSATLFLIDESLYVASIEISGTADKLESLRFAMKQDNVVSMLDVWYSATDTNIGIARCSFTDYSRIMLQPNAAVDTRVRHLKQRWKAVKEWAAEEDVAFQICAYRAQLQALLAGDTTTPSLMS
eukprot:gb/GECG01013674.1/.p1 GENE.gb/GECG01013674.1/~~gb/GECG01013674.1/.p1  ORF type:complete len:1741 (+),score=221.59 gb/GECG01013674.1/:1-5223(+)